MKTATIRTTTYVIGGVLLGLLCIAAFWHQVLAPLEAQAWYHFGQIAFANVMALFVALGSLRRARRALPEDSPAQAFLEWVFWALVGLCGLAVMWAGLALSVLRK
jgi:FtsH-binding integral membrane protein